MSRTTLSTVTPEMIEAGVKELRSNLDLSEGLLDDLEDDSNLHIALRAAYRAMLAARPTEATSDRTVRDRLAAWPNDAWDQDFRDFIDNEVLPELATRDGLARVRAILAQDELGNPDNLRRSEPAEYDKGWSAAMSVIREALAALSDQPAAVVSDAMVEAARLVEKWDAATDLHEDDIYQFATAAIGTLRAMLTTAPRDGLVRDPS